jgi:U3 small nucleolar RNA-associated protein 10
VRAIPLFVASHIDSIVKLYIQHPELQELSQSSTLTSAIVRLIAPVQLLPIIISVWEKGDKSSLMLHTTCLGFLERIIKNADRKSVVTTYKIVFRYLINVFDARRLVQIDQEWKLLATDLVVVEEKAVSVFLKLVLKLNEGTFRPLFLRVCDWALLDLLDEEEQDDDVENSVNNEQLTARKIVLFKVINALLAQLGELVTNYYLNVLDGAVEVLQSVERGSLSNEELWNENRIKAVMPSLIGQVTTPTVKSSTSCETLLGDAIASLCQTVPDEVCLKMVNNMLLEKTRSSQIKVKITAIRILDKVWKSKECENSLLNLVPETVPSISELLQESEVVVQEELSSFITTIESVLGEGLDGYLS